MSRNIANSHSHRLEGIKASYTLLLLIFFLGFCFSPSSLHAWGKKKKVKKLARSPQQALAISYKYLKKGRSLREKGKKREALIELKKSVSASPANLEACLELGDLYTELKIYSKSAELLEVGIQIASEEGADPEMFGTALTNLAENHLALNQPEKAVVEAEQAAQYLPQNGKVWTIIAGAREKLGKKLEAVQGYQKAVELGENNSRTWWKIGILAISLKDNNLTTKTMNNLRQLDSRKATEFALLVPSPNQSGSTSKASVTIEPTLISLPSATKPLKTPTSLTRVETKMAEPRISTATQEVQTPLASPTSEKAMEGKVIAGGMREEQVEGEEEFSGDGEMQVEGEEEVAGEGEMQVEGEEEVAGEGEMQVEGEEEIVGDGEEQPVEGAENVTGEGEEQVEDVENVTGEGEEQLEGDEEKPSVEKSLPPIDEGQEGENSEEADQSEDNETMEDLDPALPPELPTKRPGKR